MSYQRPQSGRGGRSQEQYGRGSSQGRARSEDPYAGPSHGQGPRGSGGGRGGRSSSVPGARVSQADVQQAMTNLFLKIRTNVEPHITADGVTGRPDYGTVGQPVDVYVNHFKIADPPVSQVVYQFDVAIEKQRAPGRARGDPDTEDKYGGRTAPPPGPPPMPDRNRCIDVMKAVALSNKWPPNSWAYDGQKILFLQQDFLARHMAQQQEYVQFVDVPDAGPGVVAQGGATARTQATTFRVQVKRIEPAYQLPVGEQLAAYMAGQLSEMPRESLHALDVALRQGAASDPLTRVVGRGLYTERGRTKIGEGGYEAWHGYTQSLNLTQCGLTVSMDSAVIAMPVMEDLLVFVEKELGPALPRNALHIRELTAPEVQRLNEACSRTKITVQVNHRSNGKLRHRVRGFTPQSAARGLFELKDGSKTTVAQYFREHYNKQLTYANLPCVVVGGSKRPEWLPIEVCRIVPDTGSRAIPALVTANIVKQAAVAPRIRQQRIMEKLVSGAALHRDPVVRSFGMALEQEPRMICCKARILPVPSLQYGQGQFVNPGIQGNWNIARIPLYKAVTLESFAVVSYVRRNLCEVQLPSGPTKMQMFLEELSKAFQSQGITMALPDYPPVVYVTYGMDHLTALDQARRQAYEKLKKPAQILFIIQTEPDAVYAEVKRICDCELGIMSQVLTESKLRMFGGAESKGMGRKMAGVALKVNTKLGGTNNCLAGNIGVWCPAIRTKGETGVPRVMLLGADVSHPTNLPGQGKTELTERAPDKSPDMPSVAAVVASMNPDCTRYAARIMTQDPLKEMITDMRAAVLDLLRLWGNTNKALPDAIVMFRDGISEGQFSQAIDQELSGIKAACREFTLRGQPYSPRITFVTVQKRHSTRIFPGEDAASDSGYGGEGNVRPGTVVDTEICSLYQFDYYLNSHNGLQGTNKAAKYSVLSDDVGFTADSMQLLTYWLCHTFCRSTTTVSYCPPAYYAHHAAFRGRCWLRKDFSTSEVTSSSSGFSGNEPPYKWVFSKVHDNMKNAMFFI
ncbi:Piwi domain-containing protein [Haematococcus lacustris]